MNAAFIACESHHGCTSPTPFRSRLSGFVISTLVAAAVAGSVFVAPASAQVVLDPAFSPDLVGPGQYAPGMNTDYLIRESYGQRSGNNLFHRFVRFDVPAGQSATFIEDAPGSGIDRIFASVGGASASRIDGILRSTIPGADLFFYNARGVIFGPNAQLDLQGAFHTSSADSIRFADDVQFGETAMGTSVTITSASPAAWGFLSANPAEIAVEGASLSVPVDSALSLTGGDLRIEGPGTPALTPTLSAPSGDLSLISIGSAGEVALDVPIPDVSNFAQLGDIALSDGALVDASGTTDQTLIIRAESLDVQDATILANHSGAGDHSGVAVDIAVRGAINFGNSGLGTIGTFKSVAFRGEGPGGAAEPDIGNAGDVRVSGDSLWLSGVGTEFVVGNECTSLPGCAPGGRPSGAGGDLQIDVDHFGIRNGAFLETRSVGPGNGSPVTINARRVDIGNDVGVFEDTFLSTVTIGTMAAGPMPPADRLAAGGDVTINASEIISFDNGGQISSLTTSNGSGGDINIRTGRFQTIETDPTGMAARSAVASQPGAQGDAGAIRIVASQDVSLENGFISSSAGSGTMGATGDISISAPNGTIELVRRAVIDVQNIDGNGSTITLAANRVEVLNGSAVQSTVVGDGPAGDIEIRAETTLISGRAANGSRSGLFSEPLSPGAAGAGAGGTIRIEGKRLRIEDGATISLTSLQDGPAGDLFVGQEAPLDSVSLDGASIESETTDPGSSGGNVEIHARRINLENGSRITTANRLSGSAGTVRLIGTSLNVLSGSEITTASRSGGAGGDIEIQMQGTTLVDRARITTDAQGATPADRGGNIDIQSRVLVLSSAALAANAPAGAGGEIRIVAGRFLRTANSPVDATGGTPALAGSVRIETTDNGTISPLARKSIVVDDPSRRLATGCEARTARNGSLYVLPPEMMMPPGEERVPGGGPAAPGASGNGPNCGPTI